MAIIKANQPMPARPVIMVVYGMPGTGKTSLCNTAENPLLIDCDRGADRAIHRQDSLICSSWEDITEQMDEFSNYKTIVIDTAKAALDDFLMDYVKRKDDVCKRNTQKAYGAMKDEFAGFISKVQSFNVDIIIIAHAKDDKDGDVTKFYPDVTGGSKDLILRKADQVGFLSMVNQKRTIRWEPDDRIIGKNVARLPMKNIPAEGQEGFDTCMADMIAATKKAIADRANKQSEALAAISHVRNSIAKMGTAEHANTISGLISKLPKIHQKAIVAEFTTKMEELGITYDNESKSFVKAE